MDANLFYFEQFLYHRSACSCKTTDLKKLPWKFPQQEKANKHAGEM